MRSKTTSLQSEYTQDGQGIGKAMKKVGKKVVKGVKNASKTTAGKVVIGTGATISLMALLNNLKKKYRSRKSEEKNK